jgi:hypothetical protein
VPFDRIVDNKNDEPIIIPAPSDDEPSADVAGRTLYVDRGKLGVTPRLRDFDMRQAYRLVFFGEKTSLAEVLGPLAAEVGADLYLCGGQISDTLIHRMARAADWARPTVVFIFSDCDVCGYWDMPVAIGRKLQAMRDLHFPSL